METEVLLVVANYMMVMNQSGFATACERPSCNVVREMLVHMEPI